MLNMTGLSLLTALALAAGLAMHTLKDFKAARANGIKLPLREYLFGAWIDTASATIMAVVAWLAQPEIVTMFPDVTKSLGLGPQQTILSSLVIGYMSNSLAGILGNRAKLVTGAR